MTEITLWSEAWRDGLARWRNRGYPRAGQACGICDHFLPREELGAGGLCAAWHGKDKLIVSPDQGQECRMYNPAVQNVSPALAKEGA